MKRIIIYSIIAFLPLGVSAQLSKNALDFMLQNPKVVKTFEHKRFGDHLFLQGGFGTTMTLGNTSNLFKDSGVGLQGSLMLGDWITPEHGVRLGLTTGYYVRKDLKAKLGIFSMDYLMNISALAQPEYKERDAFELYGIFGLDVLGSRLLAKNEFAVGAHIGIQTNFRLSNYTHFFLEPRLNLFQDDYFHLDTWRGYRPTLSFLAGFGYNILTGENRSQSVFPYRNIGKGWFYSVGGAGGALVKSSFSEMKNYIGVKASMGVGKYITSSSALRFSMNGQAFRRNGLNKMKALGLQFDYLLNLHTVFAGYDSERRYELSAIAGLDMVYSQSGAGKKFVPGVGGGLQANFFMNKLRNLSFFMEPRVDVYKEDFMQNATSVGRYDVTATLMMGLTYYNSVSRSFIHKRNDDFENNSILDHLFLQGAVGLNSLAVPSAIIHPRDYAHAKAYMGIGKWFNALSGTRLSFDLSRYKAQSKVYSTATVGVDYLLNLSNLTSGYNEDRRLELIGAAGVSVMKHTGKSQLFLGGNIGLQGLIHINDILGFYVEPQLHAYTRRYAHNNDADDFNGMMSLVAGLQLKLNHYDISRNRQSFEDNNNSSFLSIAGGAFFQPYQPRNSNYRGLTGRLSIGTWYNPVSAWRLNGTLSERLQYNHRWARAALGADYLCDFTSMAYGYDPYRVVNLRGLVGTDLAVDYYKGSYYFVPVLHVGGQLGVRLSQSLEFYLEPQLAVDLVQPSYTGSGSNLFSARMFAGLSYSLKKEVKASSLSKMQYKKFVSAGFGMGVNTINMLLNHPFSRKYVFTGDFSYGEWTSSIHGWSIGLDNETLQVQGKNTHNQNISSIQFSYLTNINSFLNNGKPTGQVLQFIASTGVTANMKTQKGSSPCFVPGLTASLKMDVSVSDQVSIYLAPKMNIMTKRINRPTIHDFEASGKFVLGTSYKF